VMGVRWRKDRHPTQSKAPSFLFFGAPLPWDCLSLVSILSPDDPLPQHCQYTFFFRGMKHLPATIPQHWFLTQGAFAPNLF